MTVSHAFFAKCLPLLTLLLGVSFHLSNAATNVFFYLLIVIGILLFITTPKAQRTTLFSPIITSTTLLLMAVWTILLLISPIFNDFNDNTLAYAKKYLRYLLAFFLVYTVIIAYQQRIDLQRQFLCGFVVGAMISFTLAILNKTTGLLSFVVSKGLLPTKYIPQDYFVSISYFAHTLFFVAIFAFGLVLLLRGKQTIGLVYCIAAIIEVFLVSQQRTGYIIFIITSIWLSLILIQHRWYKLLALCAIIGVMCLVICTDNNVSHRLANIYRNVSTCLPSLVSNHIVDYDVIEKACYSSSGLRTLYIYDSLIQIKQSLFGHGLGNIQILSITENQNQQQIIHSGNPHNEYLAQGLQLGIIGILLLIAIFFSAFRQALRLSSKRGYVYASIMLMYVVSCLFNSFLLDSLEGNFFLIIVSFIIAESTQCQPNKTTQET